MLFKDHDKDGIVKNAHDVFLNDLPLSEIDNPDIRLICQSYRNNNSSLMSCYELFKKHFNYFYQWAYNNWMTNVFYTKKNN